MNASDKKLAIITGGSRGIGKAIAERLARDGCFVVINYCHDADAANATVSAIEAQGGAAMAIQADMSKLADIRRLFSDVVAKKKPPDIVVANAGSYLLKPVAEVTEKDFDRLFALNAKGTFFFLQEAARHVVDGGRIIHISSTVTGKRFPLGAVYAGSKAAGEQFVKTLADELGPRKITVNTISPGPTDTEMISPGPELLKKLKKMSPFERLGQPRDIAGVAAFLVSEDGAWITGQNIRASGGNV